LLSAIHARGSAGACALDADPTPEAPAVTAIVRTRTKPLTFINLTLSVMH
jgi:hypothetical protein